MSLKILANRYYISISNNTDINNTDTDPDQFLIDLRFLLLEIRTPLLQVWFLLH